MLWILPTLQSNETRPLGWEVRQCHPSPSPSFLPSLPLLWLCLVLGSSSSQCRAWSEPCLLWRGGGGASVKDDTTTIVRGRFRGILSFLEQHYFCWIRHQRQVDVLQTQIAVPANLVSLVMMPTYTMTSFIFPRIWDQYYAYNAYGHTQYWNKLFYVWTPDSSN
jgi:hypothetical protein